MTIEELIHKLTIVAERNTQHGSDKEADGEEVDALLLRYIANDEVTRIILRMDIWRA